VIVATLGTNEQPFDRLVRAIAQLEPGEPMLVQYGSSQEPHGYGEWIDFLSFDELAEHMRAARVVICHAGVGSIMLARRCGKRPIVVPRRLHLGEAVDDHQLPVARRLEAAGFVTLVEDERDLPAAVREADGRAGSTAAVELPGAAALAVDLQTHLDAFGARRRATVAAVA
jgi:UDP-N-acetylglucosamine transferase subunit ALG13